VNTFSREILGTAIAIAPCHRHWRREPATSGYSKVNSPCTSKRL
jgi:hypothetical protein